MFVRTKTFFVLKLIWITFLFKMCVVVITVGTKSGVSAPHPFIPTSQIVMYRVYLCAETRIVYTVHRSYTIVCTIYILSYWLKVVHYRLKVVRYWFKVVRYGLKVVRYVFKVVGSTCLRDVKYRLLAREAKDVLSSLITFLNLKIILLKI